MHEILYLYNHGQFNMKQCGAVVGVKFLFAYNKTDLLKGHILYQSKILSYPIHGNSLIPCKPVHIVTENTCSKPTDHLNSALVVMHSSILVFGNNVFMVLLILISVYLKKIYNEIKQEIHTLHYTLLIFFLKTLFKHSIFWGI